MLHSITAYHQWDIPKMCTPPGTLKGGEDTIPLGGGVADIEGIIPIREIITITNGTPHIIENLLFTIVNNLITPIIAILLITNTRLYLHTIDTLHYRIIVTRESILFLIQNMIHPLTDIHHLTPILAQLRVFTRTPRRKKGSRTKRGSRGGRRNQRRKEKVHITCQGVFKLSRTILTQDEKIILNKGLKFAPLQAQ